MEDRLETVGPIGEVWVRVLGQDPSTPVRAGSREGLLAARVAVPYEHFEPGPKGPRFHVIDYDATRDRLGPPAELDYRRLRREVSAEPIEPAMVDDAVFRAQNAYAIAARTLAAFERALGRRVPWAFTGHQLYIVPSAFLEANAFYDRDANALLFGYFPKDADTTVYLSLSHDIVAHETTHAVLDGLRQRFLEAGLPDQGAFHEGLADIVALLLVFSMPEVVNEALGPVSSEGRVPASRTTEPALQSTMLLGLAEEVGTAFDHRRAALRRSVRLRPSTTWRERPEFVEEHRRGEILVAAVARAFLRIWVARLAPLVGQLDTVDRERAAEEGSKSADHLLTILIRAIDWLPPLEFEFEDFLEAILGADHAVAPNDELGYRGILRTAFADYGIGRGSGLTLGPDLGELDYASLNAPEFRARADEAFRFLWTNADGLGLDRDYYTIVDGVVPCVRVGPDGLIVPETTIVYRQMLNGTVGELRALSGGRLVAPSELDPATSLQLHGGGVIVVDQFGRARAHHAKPMLDWARQSRRLAYLVERRIVDAAGALGFSRGAPTPEHFIRLHANPRQAAEAW